MSDVVIHVWQNSFVELNQLVQTPFCNVQRANTGQEIISNEEAEENEIVNDPFYVPLHP